MNPPATTPYGAATEAKIEQVVHACENYGSSSVIALAGVPGTGKSYLAAIAAQRVADEPTRVMTLQFHQSYSYEQFIEGLRLADGGATEPSQGYFLQWNERALADPDQTYVVLVDELTRANVPSVLGELMTYVEHRDWVFQPLYSGAPVSIAPNLVFMTTFNPVDRSALDLDEALLRRIRIVECPPDTAQLKEMLAGIGGDVLDRLAGIFEACQAAHPDTYEAFMPFGHGVFAEVKAEKPDLHDLWQQRLRYMLNRPGIPPHPFASTIEAAYPWQDSEFTVVTPPAS